MDTPGLEPMDSEILRKEVPQHTGSGKNPVRIVLVEAQWQSSRGQTGQGLQDGGRPQRTFCRDPAKPIAWLRQKMGQGCSDPGKGEQRLVDAED